MDQDIQELIKLTTIIKVEDNVSRQVIYGEENYVSRFIADPVGQIDLSGLEQCWKNKWRFLGEAWTQERQNYRFLYDSFRFFYYSFEQLKTYRASSVVEVDDQVKVLYFNTLSGVNLAGVYHHGKKCIDLLKELNLIDQSQPDYNFCRKFSETRNKFIEHNFNPFKLSIKTDPSVWSLMNANPLLEISIHNAAERTFNVYVDYYEDYYKLEVVISEIIKQF